MQRVRRFLQHDLWAVDAAQPGRPQWILVRSARLVVAASAEFREGELSLRALGLVYTTLLSLVPFLAVTFSVLKAFGGHYRLEPLLAQALEPLGPKGAELSRQIVEFVGNLKVGVLGAVGVAGLFYTVMSLLGKVEEAFNHIWRARTVRTLARKFADYLSLVLVGPVLVFAALGLIASAQSHWLVQRVLETGPLGAVLVPLASRVMPFVLLCVAFAFLYRFLPQAEVRATSALVGGATAAILWQLAGAWFALFVASSPRYSAIYSGFAVAILFLIWLYVSWLVVLVGAQVAYLHQHPSAYLAIRRRRSHRFREELVLAALAEITRRWVGGQRPARTAELADRLDAPASMLDEHVDELVRRGILVRSADPPGVTLGRPPEDVAVSDVLEIVGDPDRIEQGAWHPGDAVVELLAHRDETARRTLEGVTLRSLSTGGSAWPRAAAEQDAPR